MKEKILKGVKTGIIIFSIYILIVLYLLLVSNRIEKLDQRSENEEIIYSLKIGE